MDKAGNPHGEKLVCPTHNAEGEGTDEGREGTDPGKETGPDGFHSYKKDRAKAGDDEGFGRPALHPELAPCGARLGPFLEPPGTEDATGYEDCNDNQEADSDGKTSYLKGKGENLLCDGPTGRQETDSGNDSLDEKTG